MNKYIIEEEKTENKELSLWFTKLMPRIDRKRYQKKPKPKSKEWVWYTAGIFGLLVVASVLIALVINGIIDFLNIPFFRNFLGGAN